MRAVALVLVFLPCAVWGQQHRGDTVDDVMQHLPMAAVFALKACDGVVGGSGGNGDGFFNGGDKSSWAELTVTAVASYVVSACATYSLKQAVRERRPDNSDRRSFPSGHATFAFAGATVLSHEYGRCSPWVTIGGYGMATLVSADRIVRDRHYLHDVLAGAAIGVAGAELTYYVRRRLIKSEKVSLGFTGQGLAVAVCW